MCADDSANNPHDGPTPAYIANCVDIYEENVPPCLSKKLYRFKLLIDDDELWRIGREVLTPSGYQVRLHRGGVVPRLYYDAHHGHFWATPLVGVDNTLVYGELPDRSTWEDKDGKLKSFAKSAETPKLAPEVPQAIETPAASTVPASPATRDPLHLVRNWLTSFGYFKTWR